MTISIASRNARMDINKQVSQTKGFCVQRNEEILAGETMKSWFTRSFFGRDETVRLSSEKERAWWLLLVHYLFFLYAQYPRPVISLLYYDNRDRG
jgi:hypothetical protein